MEPWIDSAQLVVLGGHGVVGRWPGVLLVLGTDADAAELIGLLGDGEAPRPEVIRERVESFDESIPVALVIEQVGTENVWVLAKGIDCYSDGVPVGTNGETIAIESWLAIGTTEPRFRPHRSVSLARGLVPGRGVVLYRSTGETSETGGGVVASLEPSRLQRFVTFDDGLRYLLDKKYLLGREVNADSSVASIVLTDADNTVSRAHAELAVEDERVYLTDLGSTNGTHLLDPATAEWSRLVPNVPTVLAAGSRVAVGGRQFVYDLEVDGA